MENFSGIKIDMNKWGITKNDIYGYILVNKETKEEYKLGGYIKKIEQIGEDEFLIFKKFFKDSNLLCRMIFKDDSTNMTFERHFKEISFLENNKLLLDNSNVYSIENNEIIAELAAYRSMDYKIYEVKNNQKALGMEIELDSYQLPSEYIQFIIDVETCKPISNAFSTLRGKEIEINDEYTIFDLYKEDRKYLNIVNKQLLSRYEGLRKDGKRLLLKKSKEKN